MIAAVAKNNAIGRGNKLLWRLRDDMQMFVRTTTGHPVLMGRKTFESLKGPLPKRQNIVITRRQDYKPDGVDVAHSIEEAIYIAQGEELFIIGGGIIYQEAMSIADKLFISHVDDVVEDADTFFPKIDMNVWEEVSSEAFEQNERNEKPFKFCVYHRKDG